MNKSKLIFDYCIENKLPVIELSNNTIYLPITASNKTIEYYTSLGLSITFIL